MDQRRLSENVLRVCKALQKYNVQYLIIGGVAVSVHGYDRLTTLDDGTLTEKEDLDFWYNPTYENYFNLLSVLEELGQDVSRFRNEQSPNPKQSFFRYTYEDFKLDFLPVILAILNSGHASKEDLYQLLSKQRYQYCHIRI